MQSGYQFTVQNDHSGAITLEHQWSLRTNPYPGSRSNFDSLQRPTLSQLRAPRGQIPQEPPAPKTIPESNLVEGQLDDDDDYLFSSQVG